MSFMVSSGENIARMPHSTEGRSESFLKDTERFSYRPEVHKAWQDLGLFTANKIRLHRYELIALVAVSHLETIHSAVTEAEICSIAVEYRGIQLSADDIAVMEFAGKLITKPGNVTEADVDRLKSFGITDAEIFDITLTADAYSF